jgi:hypothetical protein
VGVIVHEFLILIAGIMLGSSLIMAILVAKALLLLELVLIVAVVNLLTLRGVV